MTRRRLRLFRPGLLAITLWAALPIAAARADSCVPFIPPQTPNQGTWVVLTTMNTNHVVSFASGPMEYRRIPLGRTGVLRSWESQSLSQTFSDRMSNAPQPFSIARADIIGLSVSIAGSPTVVVTLVSHGNGKGTFTATCSADGILHGTTATVEYLISFYTYSTIIQ